MTNPTTIKSFSSNNKPTTPKPRSSTLTLITTTASGAINSSLVLPFGSQSDESNLVKTIQPINSSLMESIPVAAPLAYESKTFTVEGTQNKSHSEFNCPDNLPYAIGYTLTHESTQMVVYGQIYSNACMAPYYDLLYSSNQIPAGKGPAVQLNAFIPKYLPEGCHSEKNNATLPIKIEESAINISPIYLTINGNPSITGYQESITISLDCIKLCNILNDRSCAINGYCNQEITTAYNVKSVYSKRQITEYFCACEIYIPSFNYSFSQAIDIESAIKYNNPLATVTCSNFPTPTP